jgi:hypothetical protein
MPTDPETIDWSLTTYDGVRREQLRRNLKLTFRERLEAVEEMETFALELHAAWGTRDLRPDPSRRVGHPQPAGVPHISIAEDPPAEK